MATSDERALERPPAPGSAAPARTTLWQRLLLSEYFVLYLSIAYLLVLVPFVPLLATPANLGNILGNMWPLVAVAIGQTFVLIVGGIDLSQTSIMALTSVVGALLMTAQVNPLRFEKSPVWGILLGPDGGLLAGSLLAMPLGVLTMLLVGALIGALNGTAITRFGMPPFMVTLVSLILFSATAIWLTKTENVTALPAAYIAIGKGQLFGLPYAALVVIGLALLAQLSLSRTILGRWLYAIGTNARAATISGVPVQRTITLAYVMSGVCAAIGSVIYSTRLEYGSPVLGESKLLDVIGATVIGGTSLFGGKGKILWTVCGVLFLVLLDNTLNLLSLSSFTVTMVKGAVILLAALLDVIRTRLIARQ